MTDLTSVFSNNTKRIAIFSDVHGNKQALEAVLNDIAAKGIKSVVCNGDLITGSAHSDEVVKRIRELGIPSTRGNHERYLYELTNPDDDKWKWDNWAPIRHEYQVLDSQTKQWLYDLPEMLCLIAGKAPLMITHAAPGDDRANLTAHTVDLEWRNVFEALPTNSTLIGSHLHWSWSYRWHNHQFFRLSSVGLPLDGDIRAGYSILEKTEDGWTVETCRVPYKFEKELTDFKNSSYYQDGGLFSHLWWLELKTARWWVVPFFKHLISMFPASENQANPRGFKQDEMQAAWKDFDRTKYAEYNPDLK